MEQPELIKQLDTIANTLTADADVVPSLNQAQSLAYSHGIADFFDEESMDRNVTTVRRAIKYDGLLDNLKKLQDDQWVFKDSKFKFHLVPKLVAKNIIKATANDLKNAD